MRVGNCILCVDEYLYWHYLNLDFILGTHVLTSRLTVCGFLISTGVSLGGIIWNDIKINNLIMHIKLDHGKKMDLRFGTWNVRSIQLRIGIIGEPL